MRSPYGFSASCLCIWPNLASKEGQRDERKASEENRPDVSGSFALRIILPVFDLFSDPQQVVVF